MSQKLSIVTMVGLLSAVSMSTWAPSALAQDEPVIEQIQSAEIDYSSYDLFMKKFSLVEHGRPRIAFGLIRANARPFLDSYVSELAAENLQGRSEDEKLAHWLNLHNLVVVQAIVEDVNKNNIKKMRGTGEKPGKLWTRPRVNIDGEDLSILDIERNILSAWQDPNVLYGLYQGVRGGPCLANTAYTGETVRAELEEDARQYVNSTGIVKVKNQTAFVTPVYAWFQTDLFDDDDTTMIAHIKSHAEPKLSSALYRAKQLDYSKLNYKTDLFELKTASQGNVTRRDGQRKVPRQQTPPPSGGGYGS